MSRSAPKRNQSRELQPMRLRKLRLRKLSRRQRFGTCPQLTTFTLEIRYDSQATSKATTRLLLSLARLPAFTQHSQPNLLSPGVTETESSVILSAAEILTGEDSQSKEEIISGFFSEEGELEGVPCKNFFLPDSGSLTKSTTPRFQID